MQSAEIDLDVDEILEEADKDVTTQMAEMKKSIAELVEKNKQLVEENFALQQKPAEQKQQEKPKPPMGKLPEQLKKDSAVRLFAGNGIYVVVAATKRYTPDGRLVVDGEKKAKFENGLWRGTDQVIIDYLRKCPNVKELTEK